MSLLIMLVSGMALIVLSADYFTNGVEWAGYRLHLEEGAVGSLLAAIGTALPETLIPVVAIVFGNHGSQNAIGLGAILGAPLMLATLGFGIVGLGLAASHRKVLQIEAGGSMSHDLRFFLGAFGLALLATFFPSSLHGAIAIILVGLYGWHAWQIVKVSRSKAVGDAAPPLHALRLSTRPQPPAWLIIFQVSLALLGLVLGAHFFVVALTALTAFVKIPVFILSVIVTPIATELPEVLNSVIWVRRRKDTLAVGNVSGALAFQSSVVPALGIGLTAWQLDPWELIAGVVAWAAVFWIWLRSRSGPPKRSELLLAGVFYILFIGLIWGSLAR